MNISNVGLASAIQSLQKTGASKTEKVGTNETKSAAASEKVSFSSFLEAASSVPEVDTGKVEKLRSQIAEGKYVPNPESIALSMLEEARAFAGVGKKPV